MNQDLTDTNLCSKIDSFICEKDRDSVCQSIELIKEDVYHKNLDNGRSLDAINAGIVLSACRFEDLPVTPQDISNSFGVEIRELLLSYRHICGHIDYLSVLPTKWTVFLEDYSRSLGLEDKTISKAFEIGQNGEVNGLISGRKPRNYAASCIYASVQSDSNSTDSWITQRKLAEEANTSESSIRSTYNVLLESYNDD